MDVRTTTRRLAVSGQFVSSHPEGNSKTVDSTMPARLPGYFCPPLASTWPPLQRCRGSFRVTSSSSSTSSPRTSPADETAAAPGPTRPGPAPPLTAWLGADRCDTPIRRHDLLGSPSRTSLPPYLTPTLTQLYTPTTLAVTFFFNHDGVLPCRR